MVLLGIGGVFAAVGLPMVWVAWRLFGRDRAIARWPKAPGVIKSSEIEISHHRTKDAHGHCQDYKLYLPLVSYTYTVDEHMTTAQVIEGNEVARVVFPSGSRKAKACLERYPAGKQVSVFYDPHDPKIAYLEIRRSVGGWLLFLLGSFFLLLGIGLASLFVILPA